MADTQIATGRPAGPVFAIAAAVLFGASTPLAKLLLGSGMNPWLLAGLLYLGSGIGLFAVHAIQGHVEAPLRRENLVWILLVIFSGGIIGPVLLMIGLNTIPASSAALLLNLESLATMLIAWLAFKENVDKRLLAGAFAILAGAALLSWRGGAAPVGFGALAIAGACLAWGIDNNFTGKISGADPVQIAMLKGLTAGAVNFTFALATGAQLPAVSVIFLAGMIGFFGYGVSLVFFVLALRHLGAARVGAYFTSAPFIGALLALAMFHEPITLRLLIAGALMASGLYLHLSEAHAHNHIHEPFEHEHRHIHDAHHQHDHEGIEPASPHTHSHHHDRLVHKHPHYPDLHHRHRHRTS